MKKSMFTILLLLAVVISTGAQMGQQMSAEQLEKNLVLVDKPQAVPDAMKAGFDTISVDNCMALLTYLSSDLLEGRDTATRGYKLAADYAASLFKIWGLKPAGDMPAQTRRFRSARGGAPAQAAKRTYFQEVVFRETSNVTGSMTLSRKKGAMEKSQVFKSGIDYSAMAASAESLSAPVVFAGYGITEDSIKWNDFKNLDVKGKIVLILSEAPGKDNPKSPFQENKELKDKYFRAAPAFQRARMGGGFNKIQEINKLGPAAIIQVQNTGDDTGIYRQLASPRVPSDERPINPEPRRRLSLIGQQGGMAFMRSTVITISREIADAILENSGHTIDDLKAQIEKNLKPASMEIPGTRLAIETKADVRLIKCANVLGLLEGSDPQLKNEVIVIGAHLDHLGHFGSYIYNGADDNASGSVGVLAAARAFSVNPVKPKRSILFALWTGEEKGLLGSRYYVSHPFFTAEKTPMYFNMDMISRAYDASTFSRMERMFGTAGKELMGKIRLADFLTVNFTKGLDGLVREANQYIGLHLFLREAVEGRRGGGSDQASFAGVKIPYVYTMAASTADYHQTSDSVEKVSGELFAKACRLTYLVSFAAANK